LFEHQDYQKYDEIVPPVNSRSMDEDYSPLKTIFDLFDIAFSYRKTIIPHLFGYFRLLKVNLIEKLIGYDLKVFLLLLLRCRTLQVEFINKMKFVLVTVCGRTIFSLHDTRVK
jgi:hypothetical protein